MHNYDFSIFLCLVAALLSTSCSVFANGEWVTCSGMVPMRGRDDKISITDFGGVGDGKTINTKAFREAIYRIEHLNREGGTLLYVPSGEYLTEPFNLTSHMTLYLAKGAVIKATQDTGNWPLVAPLPSYGRGRELPGGRYMSFIHGDGIQDVVITGENGTIDGQGDIWWNMWRQRTLHFTRPNLIEIMNSTSIIISNVTFKNSPFWNIHPVYCSNVVIQNVTILAPADSPNTDGIDPDSSSHVCIEDSYISTGDDLVAVKSGWDEYGIAYGRPSQHITIRRVTGSSPFAGIAVGSETSGGVEDILVEHINLFNTGFGIHLKTNIGRGGVIKDITILNVYMENVRKGIKISGDVGDHPDEKYDPNAVPVLKDVTIKDVWGEKVQQAGLIRGLKNAPFTGICLSNVNLHGASALLKQLFVSNSNPEDLIPVKIDYNYSLPQQLSSFPSSSSSNVVPVNHKRKWGLPCQLDMVKNNANSTLGVNANVDSYDGNHNKNGSIMSENVGDVDRDRKALLNRDGVEVDLVALGTVENPYAEEIKQRTEGLNSKEDLVRFLEGLDGKWGSSRKKRRIVDASMFGNVLPLGWNLLLSLKKKKGHVWLYCGHYLSPSGRQFVSCKDISSYLLSLHSVQDTNKVNCAENWSINDSNSLSSVSMANVKNQDDKRKKNLICRASSLVVSSTSSNHEMQVALDAGDQPEDKVGNFLHCNECKMTFSEKDDLLHHQSSLHREKMYKNDLSLNDVVIVKEGNYEHVFTCNTFNKVNNFNDHTGAHERNHVKSTEESLSVDVGMCVDPSSFRQQHVREVMLKGSLGSIGNNMGETSNVNTSDHVGDRIAANGNFGVYEFLSSNNENKSFQEGSVYVHIPDSFAGISSTTGISGDGCNVQGKGPQGHSPFPCTETAAGVSRVIKNSVTLEDSKQDRVSGSGLFGSDDNVKACDIVVNDEHFCQSMNELKRDAEKFVDDDSVFGFRSRPVGQENYSAIGVKQHSNFEVLSCENVGSVPIPSISTETWSDQIKESRMNMLTAYGEEEEAKEIAPSSAGEYTLDKKCSFGTSGNGNYGADKDALSSVQEEMQFGISSVPSWYEQASIKNYGNEDATCFGKEVGVQNTHEGSLLTLSDHERIIGTEHLVDKVCRRKMEMLEVDGVQNVRTSEPFVSYSGRDRDRPGGHQIGNSGNDFIIGFGRNNLHPVEDVMAGGIWTTSQENVLQGTATMSPQVQPSSSFHAFDIMSDQDAQGLFEVQEKYNINANVEGISSGRAEPVEYSFLGSNSSNVIPMEYNVFSHNTNTEQGLDSSSWLGNNTLMPNTADNRSKSSSVCVWCRNVFYNETNQLEMEAAGAIGSMCPTCSTRIPGHFNVL